MTCAARRRHVPYAVSTPRRRSAPPRTHRALVQRQPADPRNVTASARAPRPAAPTKAAFPDDLHEMDLRTREPADCARPGRLARRHSAGDPSPCSHQRSGSSCGPCPGDRGARSVSPAPLPLSDCCRARRASFAPSPLRRSWASPGQSCPSTGALQASASRSPARRLSSRSASAIRCSTVSASFASNHSRSRDSS